MSKNSLVSRDVPNVGHRERQQNFNTTWTHRPRQDFISLRCMV